MPLNSIFGAGVVNTVEIRGLEEAQRTLNAQLQRVDPRGGLRDTMTLATGMLHRYATGIVHVRTGRLKNSIFWQVESAGNSIIGRVGTNVAYAQAEHARGGAHAFFARTVAEEGPSVNSLFAGRIEVRGG